MTENDLEFYRELFAQLDRLYHYHLIICPFTQIHRDESVVSKDYEKIKVIWQHLSSDIELIDPDVVYYRQVWDSFNRWLHGDELKEYKNEPSEICDTKYDVWIDHIRIGLDLPKNPELVRELQQNKVLRGQMLKDVFNRWKEDENFTFIDLYEEELRGSVNELERHFKNQLRKFFEISLYPTSQCFFDVYGNVKADLFLRMVNRLREIENDQGFVFNKLKIFFTTDFYRDLPIVKIESALWAGLAHQICRSSMGFPKESIANDFTFISAYLPFVDCIFVDRQCYNILTQNPVRNFLSIPTNVFSLGQRNEFLEHLKQIEANSPTVIKEKVHSLYGKDWIKPYFTIIEDRFYNSHE